MICCSAVEHGGHAGRDHHCIGERGHPGPHWCLMGHIWEAEPQDAAVPASKEEA